MLAAACALVTIGPPQAQMPTFVSAAVKTKIDAGLGGTAGGTEAEAGGLDGAAAAAGGTEAEAGGLDGAAAPAEGGARAAAAEAGGETCMGVAAADVLVVSGPVKLLSCCWIFEMTAVAAVAAVARGPVLLWTSGFNEESVYRLRDACPRGVR
jgi:hypothetical protein